MTGTNFWAAALAAPLVLLPMSVASAEEPKAKPAKWSPDAVLAVRLVGHVQVSPNGKQVAYTVREAMTAGERSEFVTHIFVADGRPAARDGGGNHRADPDLHPGLDALQGRRLGRLE